MEPGRRLQKTLGGFRRRAMVLHALRGFLLGAGSAGLAFLFGSLLVGPVAAPWMAAFTWAAVAIAGLFVAAWVARPILALRGVGVASLLRPADPALASMARSAVELSERPSGARGLVAAHLAGVDRALAEVPVRRVVPWSWLREPLPLIGLATGVLVAATLTLSDRAGTGAFALLHPGARDDGGTQIARVSSDVSAMIRFPAYMGREAIEIRSPLLEVPRGSTVSWSMQSRVEVVEATLRSGEQRVALTRGDDGRWSGRFVARESGPLTLHVKDIDGHELRDAARRSVRILDDAAPIVSLIAPSEDALVELSDRLVFSFEAEDDFGLSALELVIETAAGETVRKPISVAPATHASDEISWSAAEVGAQPGDTLRARIEATDNDDVSGPNVGRSEDRSITVASEATRRAEGIAQLEQVLDFAVHALGDRLELPVGREEEPARQRFQRVSASTLQYAEALAEVTDSAVDLSVLREMSRRVRRKSTSESRQHGRTLAPYPRRAQTDRAVTGQLEDDCLKLADMVGQSRLEDAAAVARELEALRREMTSLLAELRRTESPEARRALMAALMRARARMQELAARIAAMGDDVPQEFLNTEALPTAEGESALDQLADAVERGDLDAAERHLMELEREIDALAQSLQGASEAFGEARFGPRERAMADAMDRLQGLETEQRQLAERSERLRREVAERALDSAGAASTEAARAISEQAEAAGRTLDGLPPGAMGPMDEEAYERARQRLVDAREALQSGDLGEARRMVEAAREDTSSLARDLELSALMFPGRDGRVADAAERAERAAQQVRELEDALDEAIPRLSDFVQRAQRDQLRSDAPRQSAAGRAAASLSELFSSEPDGAPLSPDAARAVESSGEAMRRAQRALERGEPMGAARAQQDAARELSELLDRMEQEQRRQNGGGDGGSGGDGSEERSRIEIPGEDRGDGSTLRRKLLDAMRDRAPRGYESSVRRYYEELLR